VKLTIGKKLYLGFGALVTITIVIVSYNAQKLGEIRKLQDAGAVRANVAVDAQQARRIGFKLYTVIADAQLNGYNAELKTKFDDYVNESDEFLDKIEKSADTDKEKEWSASAKKGIMDGVNLFRNDMVPLFALRGKIEADKKITQIDAMIDKVFAETQIPLREFSKSIESESVEADKLFDETAKSIVEFSLILAGVAVFLAILIAFFITRGITGSLNGAVIAIQQIAKGNLMVTFDPKALANADETGILTRSMKEMSDKLNETISFALEASENVSTGSSQLSSASQGISQGSSEQAASVEEISSSIEEVSSSLEQISASIEEMTASINQNADNANQTEKIAMKSSTDAKVGGEAVQKTVSAMKQIAEKISIIQEIARQTNLLSLNASIEAARAGEHGKGFAVVASAVQKLAERSQDAAEEISKLSKSSVDVAEKAGEMLDRLVPDIQKTAELVAEINAASAEQNNGIQQVNTAVQQVNTAVQQVNAAVQQSNQVVQSNASASE
jgi:methyl-accepting chemotaxis protein